MQKLFQFENLGSVSEYCMPLVLISLAFKFFDFIAQALTPVFGHSFESLPWFLDLVSICSSYLESFSQYKDPSSLQKLDTSSCSKGNLDIHHQNTPESLEGT